MLIAALSGSKSDGGLGIASSVAVWISKDERIEWSVVVLQWNENGGISVVMRRLRRQ